MRLILNIVAASALIGALMASCEVWAHGSAHAFGPLPKDGVLVTTEEALRTFFRSSRRVSYERISRDTATSRLDEILFIARTGERIDGYAVLVRGRTGCRFGVKMSPKGIIDEILPMELSRQSDQVVRDQRFLGQFEGKAVGDGLRVGSDLLAPHGCTISCVSAADAARTALQVVSFARSQRE